MAFPMMRRMALPIPIGLTVIKNLDPPKMVPPGPYISKYLDPLNIYFTANLKYIDPSEIVDLPWVLIFRNIWTPQNIYFRAGLNIQTITGTSISTLLKYMNPLN